MEKINGSATLHVGDGNGGTRLVLNMKVWQWLIAMIVSASALFAGAYQAVYGVSTVAAERWYQQRGKFVVQERIDASIAINSLIMEDKNHKELVEINKEISRIGGIISTLSDKK